MLTIKELAPKDYNEAIRFTMIGMHFDEYAKNAFAARQLARIYFYDELEHSTDVTALYDNDGLAGFLMVHMDGTALIHMRAWKKIILHFFVRIAAIARGKALKLYIDANDQMLSDARKSQSYDGEILLFAVNPERMKQGLGSALIEALEKKYPGKKMYLFTDSDCSHEFYDHCGFARKGVRTIAFGDEQETKDFECFLYEKVL